MIKIVDNFQSSYGKVNYDKTKSAISKIKDIGYSCEISKSLNENLDITLKKYINKSKENTFFSFFKDEEKIDAKNEDDLIISISKNNDDKYIAQTGNYIGKFVWNGLDIDIKSRFSNLFLERMLNFANDVYMDDVSVSGNESKDLDISKFIIFYMFVQNLEKAFLLGLPKSYRSIQHHNMKLKGKININRFIKYDIPFQGKISSVSREQEEIQEIIDVLYKAVKIIEPKFNTKNISHIKTHLKQNKSNKFVSNETITKAMSSKALQNPIFAPYKKVLKYARLIINGNNIEQKDKGKNETYGFLINIAELFEIYVTKLLQKEFPDWHISSPQIRLDSKDEFNDNSYLYARKIIPDITMIHNITNNVMVFDTKYKTMKFNNTKGNGSDIDRCDFFQINTYMNYYNNQGNYNLKVGGLLYPIEIDGFDDKFLDGEEKFEESDKYKAHCSNWMGNDKVKFIIDGINLINITKDNIVEKENNFINRIKSLIDNIL